MITNRCCADTRPTSPGANAPSLVEIARSLQAVDEQLAALTPYTRLAEPYLRELREIRLQITALLARPQSLAPGE